MLCPQSHLIEGVAPVLPPQRIEVPAQDDRRVAAAAAMVIQERCHLQSWHAHQHPSVRNAVCFPTVMSLQVGLVIWDDTSL